MSVFLEALSRLLLVSAIPILLIVLRSYYDRILAFREGLDYVDKSYFDQDDYILNVKFKRSLLDFEYAGVVLFFLIIYAMNPMIGLVSMALVLAAFIIVLSIVGLFLAFGALNSMLHKFFYERFRSVALSDMKHRINFSHYEDFPE
jgi:hypothetical protein